MPTGSYFEYQGGGEVIPLFLEGEYNADGTVEALTVGDVPEPVDISLPLAPTITDAVMDTQTSATINWVAPNNVGRPPITAYNIYREDDGGAAVLIDTVDDLVLTYQDTGMPTDSPEIIFGFTVAAVNADGEGLVSNKVLLQWDAVVTPQPPQAPFGLNYGSVTQTGATLTWSFVPDATVTKQGLFRNGVLFRDNLDPNAITYNLTGLTASTAYNNMTMRRWNSEGWSSFSNPVSFSTLGSGAITQDPVLGQSVPLPSAAPPYRTQIPAIRVYDTSVLISRFNDYSPRVIGFTDDQAQSNNGTGENLNYVDTVENVLINFYEGSGSSAREDCELHIANGNEIDRDWQSGSLSSQFIAVYEGLRDVVHQTTGGVRRFPNASVWVDLTANNIRQYGAGPRFKPIARYLDGFAASFYPAGRTISTTGANPNPLIQYDPASYPAGSIWDGNNRNAYSFYIDPIFEALADWRATGSASGGSLVGQLDQVACWEIGIPIHHSLSGDNQSNYVRTGADATDLTQKPRYLVGGARTSGPTNQRYDMKGFLNYVYDWCVDLDVSMREMLYWNQQSNAAIPNKWETDYGKTDPDSVTAWYQWSPGYRLPNI